MKSILRRGRPRAFSTLAALSLILTATGGALAAPAAAHSGVDHGSEPGAVEALDWSNYEKITLTKDTGEPIDMAVLPDGRVLHTARNGDVRLTDPDAGTTKVVTTVPVYSNSEDGLQTISLDPEFETNQWVYLYYAPRTMTAPYPATTPTGSAPNCLPAGADRGVLGPVEGLQPADALQVGRRGQRPGHGDRAGHHQGRGSSAASAATSPVTSTSTPTATSTSRRATTPPLAPPGPTASPPTTTRPA